MEEKSLEKWVRNEAFHRGCRLIGFAEINEKTREEFVDDDLLIDEIPAKSIIILAIPLDDPILDAWIESPSWPNGKNYIDEILARIATNLALKLTRRNFPSRTIRYGAAYLKHLAIHAGLGIIGRNNLLITPEFGPHIRLRGLITSAPFRVTKKKIDSFQPCADCPDIPPCIKACPADAFINPEKARGESLSVSHNLVPHSGYKKEICREYSVTHLKQIGPFTYLWCRACEAACPVGNEKIGQSD